MFGLPSGQGFPRRARAKPSFGPGGIGYPVSAGEKASWVMSKPRTVRRARRPVRVIAALLVCVAFPAFVLTSCPAARDGIPGQLAAAKQEAQSAARSAALSLQLWTQDRSTRQLTTVQLTDARDQVVKALKGVAELKGENREDLHRQALLLRSLAETVDLLNRASAAVRGLQVQPDPSVLGEQLLAGVRRLDDEYG